MKSVLFTNLSSTRFPFKSLQEFYMPTLSLKLTAAHLIRPFYIILPMNYLISVTLICSDLICDTAVWIERLKNMIRCMYSTSIPFKIADSMAS